MINAAILGLHYVAEHEQTCSELKQRAINEYNKALTMPRKKKKRAKKEALILYSIALHGEKLFNVNFYE
jgi:hypothetical protein